MKGYSFKPDIQNSNPREERLGLKYNPDLNNAISHNLGTKHWGRLTKEEQRQLMDYQNWLLNQLSRNESSDDTTPFYFKQGAGIAMGVAMLYALGSILGGVYGGKDHDKKIPDLASFDYNTLSTTAIQAALLDIVHQQVLESEKEPKILVLGFGGSTSSNEGLDYDIQQFKLDGKITADEVQYLTKVAMPSSDLKAVIDESEREKFEELYKTVTSGNISAISDDTTDTLFELKNLANTRYFQGNKDLNHLFNPDMMLVDYNGVTVIYPNLNPWAQTRKTVFYQQMTSASLHTGLMSDEIHIRSGEEAGMMDFSTGLFNSQGLEIVRLINDRMEQSKSGTASQTK